AQDLYRRESILSLIPQAGIELLSLVLRERQRRGRQQIGQRETVAYAAWGHFEIAAGTVRQIAAGGGCDRTVCAKCNVHAARFERSKERHARQFYIADNESRDVGGCVLDGDQGTVGLLKNEVRSFDADVFDADG